MKKIVIVLVAVLGSSVGLAHAADLRMPVKAPLAAVPVFSWTGCYVGAEGGGNWGRSQHTHDDPFVVGAATAFGLNQTNGIDLSGGIAGGTIGCNYQSGNFVFGLENDFSWTNKKGTANLIPPFVTADTATTSESWLGTFRGRAGYAWDRWFIFGTGGAAITRESYAVCSPGTATGCAGSAANVAGWIAGVGFEYAFLGGWSVKAEYLHADFGKHTFTRAPTPTGFFAARDVSLSDDMARVGINYAFMPMK
jgi:outer membrane immunogenic protein